MRKWHRTYFITSPVIVSEMTKVKPIDFSLCNEIRPCHASVVGYLLIWSTSLTCLLRGQAWLWCCNGKAPGADSTHSCEPGMGVAEGRGCHLLMLRLDFAHSCESGTRAGQGWRCPLLVSLSCSPCRGRGAWRAQLLHAFVQKWPLALLILFPRPTAATQVQLSEPGRCLAGRCCASLWRWLSRYLSTTALWIEHRHVHRTDARQVPSWTSWEP